MSYSSRSGYEDTFDSDIELPYLPLVATSRYRRVVDADDNLLLSSTDTAHDTRHREVGSSKSSSKLRTRPKNLRTWKHMRLLLKLDDPEGAKHPARGWRASVIAAAAVTGLVLLINITFMIVLMVKSSISEGVGTIYEGNCALIKRWDTAIHLGINVLGTALLAASSFTMQCLSSPTRAEVDRAHANRRSLDIGAASFANLFHMRRRKGLLWLALCLSTVPLHLLWNSTIFSTSSANYFSYLIVDETFITGASYQLPIESAAAHCPSNSQIPPLSGFVSRVLDGYRVGNYTNLTANDCLNAYTADHLIDRRNLIIVSKPDINMNMSYCGFGGGKWNGSSVAALNVEAASGIGWILKSMKLPDDYYDGYEMSYVKQVLQISGTWFVGPSTSYSHFTEPSLYPVEYCLSETNGASYCQLQFVWYILCVVVACNLVKVICMSFVAYHLWDLDEPILATVGDCVASFLERPDEVTAGWCLLNLADIDRWCERGNKLPQTSVYRRSPSTRLYRATTRTRWWCTMSLFTLFLVLGSTLFGLSFRLDPGNTAGHMNVKFGAVEGGLRLGLIGQSGRGLIIDILVANFFQLLLSTVYFLYNSLYTAQWGALEWATFVHGKHKALRVTWPRGEQRSTYYLQLPWRYGIPLTLLSVLMHFLISQSVFLARLQYYDSFGNSVTDESFSDVGYSPSAIIAACTIGFAMIEAQVLHALRPLDNRIPIHGNSSAVISAMCHPRRETARQENIQTDLSAPEQEPQETSISTLPLAWGVTDQPNEIPGQQITIDEEIDPGAGHCSFSADMVELPEVGKKYQ